MKESIKTAFCVTGLLFCSLISAEQLQMEYKSFYSHLRQLNKEELKDLQFAFGFKRVSSKELCTVNKVTIHTDKQDISVPVDFRQRFILPTEKALKLAQSEVILVLEHQANQCDLSVQLEIMPGAIPEALERDDVEIYFTAFDTFFSEMGGFLSFLMPSPDGLNIFLIDNPDLQSQEWLKYYDKAENKLVLLHSDFSSLANFCLDRQAISHITAAMPE